MGSGISGLYNIGSFDYTIDSTDSESLLLHEDNQQFKYNSKGTIEEQKRLFEKSNLDENAIPVIEKYGIGEDGKFGVRTRRYQTIYSDDPVQDSIEFYNIIGKNGKVYPLEGNPNGTRTLLGDGSKIVHRIITRTKDSPAVDIQISGSERIPGHKIHFKRKAK